MPNTGIVSRKPGTAPFSDAADAVRLGGACFGYGAAPLLRDVSLAVPPGRFLTLLGPSGCGKTTLLKLVGGYLLPSSGRVFLQDRDVTKLPPEARNIGMVFQNYALFPHLTTRQNVAFGLDVRGVPRGERDRRVDEILDLVGLAGPERDRKPATLSGGQQQRVALARALVFKPDLLLLDEPLANLDRHLRDQLRVELKRLHRETGVAAIMVTHDQEEALAVSDLVGVLNAGRLLQLGAPDELYHRPRTPFVARFLGDANFLPGAAFGYGDDDCVMVRPEQCVLCDNVDTTRWSRGGVVTSLAFLGSDVQAEVECSDGLTLHVRVRPSENLRPGQAVRVAIAADSAWRIPGRDEGTAP